MGFMDKVKNMLQGTKGKGKEAVGKATDNKQTQAEGRVDQTKSDLKQAGENVKDAIQD